MVERENYRRERRAWGLSSSSRFLHSLRVRCMYTRDNKETSGGPRDALQWIQVHTCTDACLDVYRLSFRVCLSFCLSLSVRRSAKLHKQQSGEISEIPNQKCHGTETLSPSNPQRRAHRTSSSPARSSAFSLSLCVCMPVSVPAEASA